METITTNGELADGEKKLKINSNLMRFDDNYQSQLVHKTKRKGLLSLYKLREHTGIPRIESEYVTKRIEKSIL